MKYIYLMPAFCVLVACQQNREKSEEPLLTETQESAASADNDFAFLAAAGQLPPLPAGLETMPVQIALQRRGFSPGVIDGKRGKSLKIAIMGFQAANALEEGGELDAKTKAALEQLPLVPPTRQVRIPAAFANQQFFPDFPTGTAD